MVMSTEADRAEVGLLSPEELECKICYYCYNLASRRPKVLDCCHRLCSKCLAKILDLVEPPADAVTCPFCRCATRLSGETPNNLPDDCELLAVLTLQNQNQRSLHQYQEANTELLLSPRRLSLLMSSGPHVASPNFVVITIMEPPPASNQNLLSGLDYHSSSLDSMASIHQRWTVWNCAALLCQTLARVLVWVLGLLFFSSLPLGVYLLIVQRTTLGAVLVSLVPSTLILIMVYGLCQCVCHELWDCMNETRLH